MDQKEIKSLLKAVKENLDQKDFKTALKQCKSILKADRNNYLALIFYGAAVQETEHKEEATKAFKKAIEISPNHILAWQGLAAFYEKNEIDSADLLKVYGRLLILETDDSKLPDLVEKFQNLAILEKNYENVKILYDSIESQNDEKKLLLQQCIVTVLKSVQDVPEDIILIFQMVLEELISKQPVLINHADLIKNYLQILYRKKNLKEIYVEGMKVLKFYPDDIILLEWICKAYVEMPDEDIQELTNSPVEVYSKLLQIDPKSYLGYFSKGIHELHSGDPIAAKEALKEAVKLKSNLGKLWLKLCICQVMLYQFSEAEEGLLKARGLFKKGDKNALICEVKLLQCLSEQDNEEKLLEAEKLEKNLLELNLNEFSILTCLIKTQMKLGKFSEAKENLRKLGESEYDKAHFKYLECLCLKYMNRIKDYKASLEKLVNEIPDCYEPWLELGKIYYSENNFVSCLNCFLKSTKLNQWCYYNFLYLGHCYRTMVGDLEKARRCYQKAFQLNPADVEIVTNLSDIYRILGKQELNLQLLTTVTASNPKSTWAWKKLGVIYLSMNQYQDAVNSLRVAVRLNYNDKNAWECLGDAYFAQEAHTSALKSYQRVQEIDPDSVYSLLQIATLRHLLGFFRDSVEEFRIVNDKIPDYLPALKGHSEACLALMKHHLSQNLNGLAQDAGQEGITCLIKCLKKQKDLICIWKLLGDFCALFSILPEKYSSLKVPSWFSSSLKAQTETETTLNKSQVLRLGASCYSQAIALNPNFSNLWYDLAFIYNCMVKSSKTGDAKKQMRELACSAVKKSILLNEDCGDGWTLYGIILASKEIQNYPLAQHCFIKAILINDTNAVAWTNLGTLYLDLKDLQIANQSFTEAQKYDHDYVQGWVGQAIIAQKTGHHDAMDLFRHSTQLGFCSEGCLGYSNLVCSTLITTKNKNDKNYLYSIENMNAVTVASDVLTWFTDRIPSNPWAFNMLGLLLERQMIYKRSAEAFSQALQILQTVKVSENKERDHLDILDKVLLNYSRVLSKIQKYEDAISHLKQIKKATFTNQCEMAVTYFRAALYEEAYSSYETILEWLAPDVELKSHVLVAMAAVVYLHQGQEDAKILLMQSCQLKPPSVEGLFALCALGMLHSDLAMSELALRELKQYENDTRYCGHIAGFQAYIDLFKGQKDRAVRALCKVTHRHPDQPSIWLNLSLFLLHLYPSFDSRTAAKCAEVALIMGRSSIDVSKVMSLVSLSNLLSNEGLKSLKSSQKAVHMFPDATENWVVLVASVLSKCLVQQSAKEVVWLKNMIIYIRRKFESSKPMTQWLSNNNRKILVMAEMLTS